MNVSQLQNTLTITSTIASGYKYVHYIIKVNLEDEVVKQTEITESISTYTMLQDGYYKIVELRLPTTSGSGYYITGTTIYSPSNVVLSPEELLLVDVTGTNIIRDGSDIIVTYYLNEYYINIIKSKFLKNICSCACLTAVDKVLIDTLTMGLVLITKLEENSQYHEANRIISQLSSCSNIQNDANCNCYE